MAQQASSRLVELRTRLAEARAAIRRRHLDGEPGGRIAAALTAAVDATVLAVFHDAVAAVPADARGGIPADFALLAIGGYGRGDLAPHSDIDLLFLHRSGAEAAVAPLARRMVRDLWDVGLCLGQSIRTVRDTIQAAGRDVTLHTAVIEARLLAGSIALFADLQRLLHRRNVPRHVESFIARAAESRRAEQQEYGSTVYLLEPNLKKSKGGLRDLHLFRWVAAMRHGTTTLASLPAFGLLSADDARALRDAQEFLLRVRHDLHFHAAKAQDVLTLEEQVRVAEWLGYQPEDSLLGVERFMRQYYRHSTAVEEIVGHFVDRARRRRSWKPPWRPRARRIESDFLLGPEEIALADEAGPTPPDLAQTVRLFSLAEEHRVRIAAPSLERVRQSLAPSAAPAGPGSSAAGPLPPAAAERFLAMLGQRGPVGAGLRKLHRIGALERIIPAFEHARCLIQFNRYHKYTVDEHCIRAVEEAERLVDRDGPLGQVAREIRPWALLRLALLIHDLGKGLNRDHSEAGRAIAGQVAARLGLRPHDRDLLAFLVHRHLLMANTAFRRDISDDGVLVALAREVGTPEALKMLYVLTAADAAAVGPDGWNGWKQELLTTLYARVMEQLSGNRPVLDQAGRLAEVRADVLRHAGDAAAAVGPMLETLSPTYLLSTPPPRIVEHLHRLAQLGPAAVLTTGEYNPQTGACEYTVYTFDNLTPGIFAKIAGVLAAKGLQILSARVNTQLNGAVIDCWQAADLDHAGPPPAERIDEVGAAIRSVLLGERTVDELFAQHRRYQPRTPATPLPSEPTRVRIDNTTSERSTVIDVFARDRQGLLYVIARTMLGLELSVSQAIIATHVDRVADVFYVTDRSGAKIGDEARLDVIRRTLAERIDGFEAEQSGSRPSIPGPGTPRADTR